jgi:hypothetical protein
MACVNVTSQGARKGSYSHLQADILRVFSLRVQGQRPAGGGVQQRLRARMWASVCRWKRMLWTMDGSSDERLSRGGNMKAVPGSSDGCVSGIYRGWGVRRSPRGVASLRAIGQLVGAIVGGRGQAILDGVFNCCVTSSCIWAMG